MTITPADPSNHPPVATDDSLTVKSNLSDFVYVLGNDSDPDFDSLSVVANTDPAHGSVDCVAYGYCQYTPAHNYDGPDGFDYTVSDGRGGMDTATMVVTVDPNHPPVAADDVKLSVPSPKFAKP